MRFLFRLLLSDPKLLFAVVVIGTLVGGAVAFALSVRRARALAELSDDPSLASGQARQLAIVALVAATIIGVGAWWSFFRVHTEPDRVLVAIAVESEAGARHWWQDDTGVRSGPRALASQLHEQLDAVGLEAAGVPDEERDTLRDVSGDDPEALRAAALELEARWLIRGRVRPDKVIALELAEFSDYVMSVELELVDAETGAVTAIAEAPLRVFLWGDDPGDAVALNARYLAERVTMPLIAALAQQPALREYAGDRSAMTTDQAVLATALEPLFRRADSYAEGLALRERDVAEASEREPQNHAALRSTRLSDILAEEYFIGAAADGRALLLADPKHVTVVPGKLGYSVSSEGEALLLVDPSSDARELLFEHYNFYSDPAISADGRVVWTTVANHGASKSLAVIDVATGEFAPILSHPTDYYTSPIPAPDGARALFFSRAGRYAETSIELIERDGSGRRALLGPDDEARVPAWAPDGRSIYAPIGSWQRIVAIDVESGERRHLLGQDPAALAPTDEDPELAAITDDAEDQDPDPATSSRFSALSVGHDGRTLYLVEQSLDGRRWLGRLDLERAADPSEARDEQAPAAYARLAQIEVGRVLASPTAPIVAFEAPAFTAPGDPESRDQEVLIYGPDPGQLRALTLNAVDDELAGWSRDGERVFTLQRARDPGSETQGVARVYVHALR